jgi:lysophospholipase L1-like esterase
VRGAPNVRRVIWAAVVATAAYALGAAPAIAGPTPTHTLSVSVGGDGTVTGSGMDCSAACVQSYPVPSTSVIGFGHSIEAGYGASDPSEQGWMGLLSADLGATDFNYGVPGAVAAYPEGGSNEGGWAYLLAAVNPGRDLGAAPLDATFTLMYGLNDEVFLGGPAQLGPFDQAMTTMISSMDSVALFDANDPTVSAPADWTLEQSTNVNSGGYLLSPESTGDPLTIDVPSTFAGGTIALGFTTAAGGATPTGQAVYEVRVDGGASTRYVIDGPTMVTPLVNGNGGWIGTVDRLTGLTPGPHTITVALDSSTGTIASSFNYWEAEAPFAEARPLIVPLQYETTQEGYSGYDGEPYVPDDAGVQALNADIEEVVAQFPANVQTVALNLDRDPANLFFDQLHPNDAGYALIAQQVLAQLSSVTLTATAARGWTFTGWSGAGCSGTAPCTIAVDEAESVHATFTEPSSTEPHQHDPSAATKPATHVAAELALLGWKRSRDGSVVIRVQTRAPGRLTIEARHLEHGHELKFGSVSEAVRRAERLVIALHLDRSAARLLRDGRRLRIELELRFVSSAGHHESLLQARIVDAVVRA